jgi:hypothetical protein
LRNCASEIYSPLPADLVAYLAELDSFILREIKPLEERDDNIRFFDHRREWARTDFDNGGLPRHEWEAAAASGEESRRRRRPSALLQSRSAMAAKTAAISGWL